MPRPDVFAAIASPVRRRLLELLRERPSTVNALVDEFKLRRPAVSEHLQVLRAAKLVTVDKRGRERFYRVDPSRLAEVQTWLAPFERYWKKRLRSLARVLDEQSADEENT